MDIAGLQETHWFGCEQYRVTGAEVITSGRPVPGVGEPCQRGEGVAFVLRGNALKAWRAGGCQSPPLSARVMSLRLRFELENGNTDWITIVTAYAPTFRSKRSAKDEFYASLQNVMNNIAPK